MVKHDENVNPRSTWTSPSMRRVDHIERVVKHVAVNLTVRRYGREVVLHDAPQSIVNEIDRLLSA